MSDTHHVYLKLEDLEKTLGLMQSQPTHDNMGDTDLLALCGVPLTILGICHREGVDWSKTGHAQRQLGALAKQERQRTTRSGSMSCWTILMTDVLDAGVHH